MPRVAKLWQRADRPGWWATIGGKQVCFGEDFSAAQKAFHEAKARAKPIPYGVRIGVLEAVDRFLDDARNRVRPKTFSNYRTALQHWVDDFGRMALDALRAEHLETWLIKPRHDPRRKGRGPAVRWSKSTRHVNGTVVKIWMRWCRVKRRWIGVDPFEGVRLPGIDVRQEPPPGALERILVASEGRFRDFLLTCYETGCRPGEIRTLEGRQIVQAAGCAIVRGKTGERAIGLSDVTMGRLEPLLAKYPSGPLLRNSQGKPWTEQAILARMRRLTHKLGLTGQVTTYHCRHAFWARANRAGVGDIQIAAQLGHKNLNMLATRYAHPTPEIMRDTARKANEIQWGRDG